MSTQKKPACKRPGMWATLGTIVRAPGWGPTVKLLTIVVVVALAGNLSGVGEILDGLRSLLALK